MQRRLGWEHVCAMALITLLVAACEDTVVTTGSTTSSTTTGGGDGGNGATGADGGAGGGVGGEGGVEGPTTSDKVDILMVVDNSRGVVHMQDVLAESIPRLVSDITALGVADMHIGVVSSSLGGIGADACSSGFVGEDDGARLIDRAPVGTVATYEGKGFLAWDPNQTLMPPGEASEAALNASISDLVLGAGDTGCGYESPLEAFYRFLIDPDPYASIALENNSAVLNGTDDALLQQRADFLRPDSLLMIVIASDENDCSTRAGGQFYFARQIYQPGTNQPFHLPPARAACADDPADACCRSCGQGPGAGCSEAQDQCAAALSSLDDNINLRCFEQKRRFGIDFLWPIDRYRAGLSHAQVEDRYGNIVANPLYTGQRGSELVIVAGIVGIPWQLSSRGGNAESGAQRADEMTSQWSAVLGDPASYTPPSNPYMLESIGPRSGIPGPSSDHDADAIVGHDHTNPQNDGLQYACVWDLATPVDCTGTQNCSCNDAGNDDAVCQDPATDAFTTTQYRGSALPGLRHLELLRGLGPRAVVGSVCPAQLTDTTQVSFGHHPTFATLAELAAARID